jgi:microcystin-dependent protein
MFESYIGTILKLPYPMEVKGWLPCHGQLLQIQFYAALYTLIQNTYGGENNLTFRLPDLRQKRQDGSYYRLGEIMEDGTPYMDSFICTDGVFPELIR